MFLPILVYLQGGFLQLESWHRYNHMLRLFFFFFT